MKRWQVLSSESLIDNFWVKVRRDKVQLADGKVLDDFYVVDRRPFSIVFAITKHGDAVLVRQYRHGAGRVMIELPAGYIDDGEMPEDAARRELTEETGYTCGHLKYIGEFFIGPSGMNHSAYGYLALDAERTTGQSLDSTEDVEILTMPIAKLSDAIVSGEINCAIAVAVAMSGLEIMRKRGLLDD